MIRDTERLEKISTIMNELKSKVKNPDHPKTFFKLFCFETCMRKGLIELNPSLYNKYTTKQLEKMSSDYRDKKKARRS